MSDAPIRDAAVIFEDGVITQVGTRTALLNLLRDAEVFDAGNSIIVPGLINAHTHLELSNVPRPAAPARFIDWVIQLMQSPVPAGGMEAGIAQCLKFGVTAVGDITTRPMATREILNRSPLRGVSFGEVRAMAQRRAFLQSRIEQSRAMPVIASQVQHADQIRAGITPHAPYSIESTGYARCLQEARQHHLPLATHLAETREEAEFLSHHTGPFRELWELLNAWDKQVPTFAGGPIRFAESIGLLDHPTVLAHVNFCHDDEMRLLADGNASVVYCPRTHAYFSHPPHRWREMLAHRINVAVGTDSCASAGDLNLVDDLRLLHQIAPEVETRVLWEMATVRAARALGAGKMGALARGNWADAAVFPLGSGNKSEDPLSEVLECSVVPAAVWVGGRVCGRA